MKKEVLASVLLMLSLGCGKGPTLPTPIPSPSATPPVEEVFPGRLHVDGTSFRGASGRNVTLLGGIVCCVGYPANGWPLISDTYLRTYAENGANFTHVRLGPFTAKGESPLFVAYKDVGGGRVDLNEWDEAFWGRLAQTLSLARQLGVYVELDLIDSWVLKHEEMGISPWQKFNNINGVDIGTCFTEKKPIDDIQKRWITKIIDVTRGFDNVIYQVSNESFDCRIDNIEWEQSIIDYVHSLHPSALVGTNSNKDAVVADYIESHAYFAQPPRGKPMMVNEYGGDLTPSEVCTEMKDGLTLGSSFHYWRGGHDDAAFSETLACLRAIRSSLNAGN